MTARADVHQGFAFLNRSRRNTPRRKAARIMSRKLAIVKNSLGSPANMAFTLTFVFRCMPSTERWIRLNLALQAWALAFVRGPYLLLHPGGKNRRSAHRKKALQQVDPVGILADEHPVFVTKNPADNDCSSFLRRNAQDVRRPLASMLLIFQSRSGSCTGVLRNPGRNPGRMDARNPDRACPQLLPQALTEATNSKFARTVCSLAWRPEQAKHAGNVHDVRFRLFLEQRQKELASVNHTPKVDAYEPLHLRQGEFGKRAEERDSCVVDQEGCSSKIPMYRQGEAFDRCPLGNIYVVGLCFGCSHEFSGLIQCSSVYVGQGQLRAERSQLNSQSAADARTGTSHNRDCTPNATHRRLPIGSPGFSPPTKNEGKSSIETSRGLDDAIKVSAADDRSMLSGREKVIEQNNRAARFH